MVHGRKRGYEGLEPHVGHQRAVAHAHQRGGEQRHQAGHHPVRTLLHQVADDDAGDGHHRADGQVDAAGQYDVGHAHRQDAVHGDLAQHVDDVLRRQEHRREELHDDDDQNDDHQQAELSECFAEFTCHFFLLQTPASKSSPDPWPPRPAARRGRGRPP